MAHTVAGVPARPSIFSGLGARISEMREEWGRIQVFRRTYDELSSYSNRQLEDIGVTRMEIVDLAKEAAWGKAAR